MKLSNADEIRISILMALAIGEIVGLFHFFGQPTFIAFFIHSLAGILIIIPLLWLEWIQWRGVSYFSVLYAICVCTAMTAGWNEGTPFEHLVARPLIVGLPIMVTIKFLRKLLRPIDTDQQDTFLKNIRPEDNWLGRITRHIVGLFTCILFLAYLLIRHKSILWAVPLVIPSVWFAWRLFIHLFINKWSVEDLTTSSESVAIQGGRA